MKFIVDDGFRSVTVDVSRKAHHPGTVAMFAGKQLLHNRALYRGELGANLTVKRAK